MLWASGKQRAPDQFKSVHSGEVRLSLTEEEEQDDAEGQSLLSQQQQKSDEPEPTRSKVGLGVLWKNT